MPGTANPDRGLSRWVVTTGAWILAGFLVITIALIFTAREESLGDPSVTNTRGSGYAAFAELLRHDGYRVRLDRSVRPEFAKDDLVIAVRRPLHELAADVAIEGGFGSELNDDHTAEIASHVRSGGTVLELVNSRYFEDVSDDAERDGAARQVTSAALGEEYELSLPAYVSTDTTLSMDGTAYAAWTASGSPYVHFLPVDAGLLVTVAEGLPLTNRYLDQDDNAEFFLDLVRRLAPAGSSIVFDEAGIGNAEAPTVANTLGRWAVVARWQILLLFAVVIYTYARRFGLPETERRTVRSTRELFDAIADVMRRTRNTGLALDNLLIECDERMRRVLGAPASLKRTEVLQLVPKALRDQYLNVAEHANANSHPRAATAAASKLVRLLEAFEHDSREARGLKR